MNTARKKFRERFYQNPHAQVSDVYEKRGEVHRLIGKYDKALFDFNRFLYISDKLNKVDKKAKAYSHIGNVHLIKSNFKLSEENYNNSYNFFSYILDKKGMALCYQQLGEIQNFNEKYDEAIKYYNNAKEIFVHIKDNDGMHSISLNIADCYRRMNQYENALLILEEAINYYRKENNRSKLCRAVQVLGNVYCDCGESSKGLQCLNEVYNIANMIGDNVVIIYLLCDIGLVYYNKGDYRLAAEMFEKCLELSQKNGINYMVAISFLNMGDSYIKIKNYTKAKFLLEQALIVDINIEGIKNEARRLLDELNLIQERR